VSQEKGEETYANYNSYEEPYTRSRVPNKLTYWWVGEGLIDNVSRKGEITDKNWKTEAAVAQHAFPSANPSLFPSEALLMSLPPPTFSPQSVLESFTNPKYPFSLSTKGGISGKLKDSSMFQPPAIGSQIRPSAETKIIYDLESLNKNIIGLIISLLKSPLHQDATPSVSFTLPRQTHVPPYDGSSLHPSSSPPVDVLTLPSPSPFSPYSPLSPSINTSFHNSFLSPFFFLQLHHQIVVILGSSISYQKTLNIFGMGLDLGQYLGGFKEINRHVEDLKTMDRTANLALDDTRKKDRKMTRKVGSSIQGSEVVVMENNNKYYESMKREREKIEREKFTLTTLKKKSKNSKEEKMEIEKKFNTLFRLEAKPCPSLVEMIEACGVDDEDNLRYDDDKKNIYPPLVSLLYPSCISFTYLKSLYVEEEKLYDRILDHVNFKLPWEPPKSPHSLTSHPSLPSRHSFPLSFPHTSLSSLFHSPPTCSFPFLFSVQGFVVCCLL
jgi:hypothetical protein